MSRQKIIFRSKISFYLRQTPFNSFYGGGWRPTYNFFQVLASRHKIVLEETFPIILLGGETYCPDHQCWVYFLIFLITTILLVSVQKGYSRIMSTEYDEEEMGESGPVTTQNYKLCSNF